MAVEWTNEQKVRSLLSLPWTITTEVDPDDRCLVARVEEIPGVIGTGADSDSLQKDFWSALRAALEAMIADGDRVPLPSNVQQYPWELPVKGMTPMRSVEVVFGPGFSAPVNRRDSGASSPFAVS